MTPSKTASRSGSDDRVRGIVQRLLPERGYGFIRAQSGQYENVDFFFHLSSLVNCRMDDLKIGDEVRFEPTTVARGLRAEQIELLG